MRCRANCCALVIRGSGLGRVVGCACGDGCSAGRRHLVFDIANRYGAPQPGRTEEITGRWFAKGGGRREKVVLIGDSIYCGDEGRPAPACLDR